MRTLILLLFVFVFVGSYAQKEKDFYGKRWSTVYSYEMRVQPRSALAVVDSIYNRAKSDKNSTQFTKALLYQSKFAVALEENAELKVVERFRKEIAVSSAPLKNILESMLANIYWNYFQENRHNYYERSRTTDKINTEDFRTWDAQQIFEEAHLHYQNSLKEADQLKKIKLEVVDELLIEAWHSKLYRPTVYDLLAHNAIDFYRSGESQLSKPKGKFVLNDERYFEDFENISLGTSDSLAPNLQTLRLFQALLSFHKSAQDTAAYVNLEIERLQFLVDESDFENRTGRRQQALQKLKSNYNHHSASALIDFEIASYLDLQGSANEIDTSNPDRFKKAEALRICELAIKHFPGSDGAEKCKSLRSRILSADLSLEVEKHVPIQKPALIGISYKNVQHVSFTIYRVTEDWKQQFEKASDDSARSLQMKTANALMQWSVRLKDPGDYLRHRTEVKLPALDGGQYLIYAERADTTALNIRIKGYAFIQTTNLALLKTELLNGERFQVVDRNTGKPIEKATAHLKTIPEEWSHGIFDKEFTTGKDGFFEVKDEQTNYSNLQARVRYGADQAVFEKFHIRYYSQPVKTEKYDARVFLFTDRSIYRPGQKIFFKGILLKVKDEKSTLVSGEYVEVFLEDVNGEEVASLRLKSNSYGSFSGEFQLPQGGLAGEYTLYADEDSEEDSNFYDELDYFDQSETTVSVEEYKRPTFEVTFTPLQGSYRVNDTVKFKGKAQAFSGSMLSKAKINYHVTRKVHYPHWSPNRRRNYSRSEEIISGEAFTDANGEFSIDFIALPDEHAAKEDKPVFYYEVVTDVTDVNGETRSATSSARVGYHSLLISIAMAPTIQRTGTSTINISTTNLNDQFLAASGQVRIYKLLSPAVPVRQRVWDAPDVPFFSEDEFHNIYPHEAYGQESDPEKWSKGKMYKDISFDSEKSMQLTFDTDRSWPEGTYAVELTTDPNGTALAQEKKFELVDVKSKVVADNRLFVFETDKAIYNPGEIVKLKIGSASEDITVTVDVEYDKKIIRTFVEHLSGNTKELHIPVKATKAGEFFIHGSAVSYNSFIHIRKDIAVTDQSQQMEIETVTFKDKLQPGGQETWSFEIKGSESMKKEAEVLASMYDASLDQFKKHEWRFDTRPDYYSESLASTGAENSFENTPFTLNRFSTGALGNYDLYYDHFDFFGFSITNNGYVKRVYLDRLYSSGANPFHPSKVTMIKNRNGAEGFIYGKVVAHDGSAIPGVNVSVKGSVRGTVTDSNGAYTLEANKGETVMFSFIGYSTAEAEIGKKNTVNVLLEEDVKQLSEVIVTGYGVQMKREVTGSVTTVKESTLSADVTFEQSLQGKVAGVQIMTAPGSGYNVVIRGTSTIDAGKNPLYVIDGVITESSKINASDLQSIEVLKGEAAASIYGARASNGVIIITTKTGQKKADEEMAKLNARKNFNETAFFFPHLTTDETGKIRFTFTTPESLTRWKLQLLAHNRDLISATKTLQAVTQKELMLTPNAPRFLRLGDQIIFSARIANMNTKAMEGKAMLQLTDAISGAALDAKLGNTVRTLPFKVNGKGTTEVSWRLTIPEGVDMVQYKVMAKAGNHSDGEQNAMPVLSNRTLVTETMPLFVRGGQKKTFTLDKLKANTSSTLQHHQLTLEITSNPAWYAVQSLPYLMEFPHECAEQLFSRYYANALGSHIANSSPKIKKVFDEWAGSKALESNLEKNKELRSILIEETPWLRDAKTESEQKKRIGLLFDFYTMTTQLETALNKLESMQLSNGGFPWFSGGDYASRYITQHVVSGFGHLRKLNVMTKDQKATELIKRSISYLDYQMITDYDELIKGLRRNESAIKSAKDRELLFNAALSEKHLTDEQVHYLYMRSFFPGEALSEKLKEVIAYYRHQSEMYWTEYPLYLKGMIALIHYRNGSTTLPKQILTSLKETSTFNEELGRYWKENQPGWYWQDSPIETQALLIEAFAEIESGDLPSTQPTNQEMIDELRNWLLKNKQTTLWKSTKATTEAIYALLLKGTDWTSLDKQVEVSIGGKTINTSHEAEAGTGYMKTVWKGKEIVPALSEVTIEKKDKGIAWGGLYWQYFEDLDKITSAATPLKLNKKVFVVKRDERGELLTEVNTKFPLEIGDLLRVRIELSVDRPMEFLHMKDMRASGTEPVNVLSDYKWQDGLSYYESTKDAATHFFFDRVNPGIYVFEYDLRINNRGDFSNGITTIESMYAPEFTSHSEGIRINVK